MNPQPAILKSFESRVWHFVSGWPNLVAQTARVMSTMVRGSVEDRIWLRAGNMTYLSLLYMVPVGALALSLASHFGWQGYLTHWIQERLSPTAPELASNIVAAMERLDIVAMGYIGLAAIIIAGVIALSELEEDFCQILYARKGRDWWQRVLMYPLTILVAPTIIAVVLALGALAEVRAAAWIEALPNWGGIGQWVHHVVIDLPLVFELTPYILTWILLTILYYLVTSAPVRLRAALVGGLSAGIVWQLAQKLYIHFQFASATYTEIWGYLAQIPLLLLWLYVSWVILFLGAELVFAWQYRHAYLPKWPMPVRFAPDTEARVVIEVVREIIRSRDEKPEGVIPATISTRHRIPMPLVARIAHELSLGGFLQERRTRHGYRYTPSKNLHKMTLRQLLEAYRSTGVMLPLPDSEAPLDLNATLKQLANGKEEENPT